MFSKIVSQPAKDFIEEQTNDSTTAIHDEKHKVNAVCDAFLSHLCTKDGAHLNNEITAHTCKSPPDLDAALKLVSKRRGI